MTKQEIAEVIQRVCKNQDQLWITDHFWDRARQRLPGFTTLHVYAVLQNGQLRGEPNFDDAHGNFEIKVRAKLPDFGWVELVAGVSYLDGIVCITVYSVTKG